jgi:hypothetical protein
LEVVEAELPRTFFAKANTEMQMNFIAILVATVASYVLGSLWYLLLGRSWRAAVGWTETRPAYRPTPVELLIAFLGQLVLALALSGLIVHMGGATVRTGIITALIVGFGFVLPTLATNVIFQRRNWARSGRMGFTG